MRCGMFFSIEDVFIWGAILFVVVILVFFGYKIWNHYSNREGDDDDEKRDYTHWSL